MSKYTVFNLHRRIAEESQLLAEEKWLIKTLAKIKNERNSLQIERLELESMKLRQSGTLTSNVNDTASTKSVVNLMHNAQSAHSGDQIIFDCIENNRGNNDCNTEPLNLRVTNSVFGDMCLDENCFEEEEDDDEDDAAMDMIMDINMMMNGQSKQ
ncbi:uncharacterized protein LOC126975547 [Leptidea sinapis]|uniref:uncharacterized protein LOC126975547 n=1 Tax=Leptidea sinapis TaxID=189913 RepID=UPI00213F7FE9|nr:uncharacterized protein LOC126975547 [Leptidea sinapis]